LASITESKRLRRIAVTFALPAEFAAWRRQLKFDKTKDAPLYRARIGENEINVVMTGVACRSGDGTLREVLGRSDACIASGLAGGLRPGYAIGSLVVAERVTSDPTRSFVVGDPRLIDIARKCGATSVSNFVTCSRIVNSPAEKRQLSMVADVVEMESFQVLRLAHEAGVPAVAVRAISDDAHSAVPFDFNPFIGANGKIQWPSAVLAVMKAPQKLPQLIRFGKESSRAARNLSQFLDGYVKVLMSEI
jgi:nucleoside phosphorylase